MKKFLQAVILYENNEIHIIHEFNVGVRKKTLNSFCLGFF
jgi:hypothetical protein